MLQEYNSQALSNSLWAFSQLRHDPGRPLLDAAAQQLLDNLPEYNPQVICPCSCTSVKAMSKPLS